jgi:hypothetical protein
MTCLVSTKRKEIDGSYSVLVTCLSCGYSIRVDASFDKILCLNCSCKLHKTKYLSQKALKERISNLEKELKHELDATAKTVIAGFSPTSPFLSYKKSKQRLKRIAALPEKIKKDQK